ncbi:polyprenol monophosphomannose synthase [Candidatus Fermentibacteria bacterium]|nr:polyprenol monophosphomannose synthase [Candidatus Fermentibacteria bacterium]
MNSLVVIPTYNERTNITQLLPQLLALDRHLNVLVVDDNSPDGTGTVVAEHAARDGRVSLLQRPGKMGLGSAYLEGFRRALAIGPDCIVQMDADFSHNPAMVPTLLQRTADADVVIGSRYLNGVNVVNWPLSRLLLSYTANIYARALTGVPVRDLTGGFKCFTLDALQSVPLDRIRSDGYSFQIETTYWCYRSGCRIAEVPIVFEDRHSGTSKMTKEIVREAFWLVLRLGLRNLTHSRRHAPQAAAS